MDYTTVDRVKLEAIKTDLNTDNDLLALLVTGASRAIDRKVTGAAFNDAANYFEQADMSGELLNGRINKGGNVVCAPRKPVINSIASMEYRISPLDNWTAIETTIPDGQFAIGWLQGAVNTSTRTVVRIPGPAFVRISYNGGLAEDVANLPADLIELATLLTARFYREAETGLADAIGVAELGTLIYTKAWPVRFLGMLEPFIRRVGWSKLT